MRERRPPCLTPLVELDLFDIWSLLVIPACLFVNQVELDNILDDKHRMDARKAFPKPKCMLLSVMKHSIIFNRYLFIYMCAIVFDKIIGLILVISFAFFIGFFIIGEISLRFTFFFSLNCFKVS